MRITIVAHALSAGGGISVGRNIIKELMLQMPQAEFQIFIPLGLEYESVIASDACCETIVYKKSSLFRRWLFDRFVVERAIEKFSPDVVICLGNRGVSYSTARQWILCHDPHLFYPVKFYERELQSKKIVKWLQKKRLAADLNNADVVFCQTSVALDRLKSMYNFEGYLGLLPNAVSVDVRLNGDVECPAVIKQSEEKFKLFYLTRYYPHKNIELLVDLFFQYKKELSDVVLYITIDSNQHVLADKLLRKISKYKLGSQIVNVGPLKQSELSGYFLHVDALVMPTTLESFSGTYLEAMSFECPIFTSDLDFSREICGDAALYFDPWSCESLLSVIQEYRSDPLIQQKLKINMANRMKVGLSTWKENVGEMVKMLTQASQ